MQLAIIPLIFTISPAVASIMVVPGPQQACPQVPASNFELTIHDVNTVNIYQSPSPQPERPNSYSNHQPALIRWGGWWILVIFLIHLKWGRYWSQAWEDRTGRISLGCPTHGQLRVGRNYTVSSGTSTLAEGDSALPPAGVVHDKRNSCSQASTERGRRSATATASNNGLSLHPNPLSSRAAAQSSLIEGGEHNPIDTNDLANSKVPELPSSPRILSAPAQAPPSPSKPPVELPSTPARSRRASAHLTSKRTGTIPILRPLHGNTSQVRPRYQSLPHDPGFKRTPPRSTKVSPLKTTLYAGSKDLTLFPVVQCFILFIAVNVDEGDSERDLRFFQEMLHESTSIYFEPLAGPNATRDNIKAKITSLYLRAGYVSDDSLILVLLSGKSDASNSMRLPNAEVVTEENLRDWVADVRSRSGLSNIQTIPIVFDICRENKDVPSAEMCQIVELTWTCSLGQRAHALEFEPHKIPSSCFLLAFFLASFDVSNSDSPDFEGAFKLRIGQLDQLRVYSYNYWHDVPGKCDQCATEIGGRCAPPGPQEPEWGRIGCDAVANLGALIAVKYPKYVRNIVEVLTSEMRVCGILEADRISPFVPEPHRHVREQHHSRGAAMPALQTPVPGT